MTRNKEFPLPHDVKYAFTLSTFTTSKSGTIVPIVMQDEAKDPAAINTHPEHASFAVSTQANCSPDSHVNKANAIFRFALTKHARETDKMKELRVMVAPIYTAFKEPLDATDELSTNKISDILELQTEATDRQCYPIWNGTKLDGDDVEVGADTPGLTTNTNLEGVTINPELFYNAFHYYTNGQLLKTLVGPIRWLRVSERKHFEYTMKIKLNPKTKYMNPYTFAGLMIKLPAPGSHHQIGESTDDTTGNHIDVKAIIRYNEYNQNFDHLRV